MMQFWLRNVKLETLNKEREKYQFIKIINIKKVGSLYMRDDII